METSVLIMAAGNAVRFNSYIKQLLPIPPGETIIARQIRQINRLGYSPVIVTHQEELARIGECFVPENRETLCNSMLSTASLWSDRTVIILGDVIFTKYGIELLFSEVKPVAVVGNSAEMYGMSFLRGEHDKVKECLATASQIEDQGSRGKMRYFYKTYTGVPMGPYSERKVLAWLWDATNDVDSQEEYNNTVAQWNKGNG